MESEASNMLRYLSGLLIIQVATVALILAAGRTSDPELWIAIGCLAVVISLVTAFWFESIASHIKKDAITQAKDEFSREREKLRVNAERQKSCLIKKATNRLPGKPIAPTALEYRGRCIMPSPSIGKINALLITRQRIIHG
jgi:cobalamin biosynthesis protein CobD/CbiB